MTRRERIIGPRNPSYPDYLCLLASETLKCVTLASSCGESWTGRALEARTRLRCSERFAGSSLIA